MKRKLLVMAVLCSSMLAQAQIITFINEPASIAGDKAFTWADPPDWGTMDLNDPVNAIEDTLAIALDGTAADSLCCDTLTGIANVDGKIAVLWRGACNFSLKALNAQYGGAVGVIIINHSGAPVGMGAGASGALVTIPTVMVSTSDGTAIINALKSGATVTAFIGNKQNKFGNDLGVYKQHVWLPPSGSKPALLAGNASELSSNLGAWVHNYGSNDQSNVTLGANVDNGGSSVYNQTSSTPVIIPSGDSAFISLPDFSQTSYAGFYDLTYTLNSDSLDEFEADNTFETSLYVDSLFSYATVDPVSNKPMGTQFFRIANQTAGFSACVHFRDANASRAAVIAVQAASNSATTDSLQGQLVEANIFRWDDIFTDLDDAPTFDFLTLEGTGEYIYSTNQQGEVVTIPLNSPVILEDNIRYLFCAATVDDRIFLGHIGNIDYQVNLDTLRQPLGVIFDQGANTWNANGFGPDAVAAVAAVFADNDVSVTEPTELSTSPAYPNPTNHMINIPLKDVSGNGSLEIMDMNGRMVATQQVRFNGNIMNVNVSDLDNGTYMFQLIKNDGTRQSFRVVVNK